MLTVTVTVVAVGETQPNVFRQAKVYVEVPVVPVATVNEANWFPAPAGVTEPIKPVPDAPPVLPAVPPPAVDVVDTRQSVFKTSTEPWQTLNEPSVPPGIRPPAGTLVTAPTAVTEARLGVALTETVRIVGSGLLHNPLLQKNA